jgi:hypothetical protein
MFACYAHNSVQRAGDDFGPSILKVGSCDPVTRGGEIGEMNRVGWDR